MNEPTKSPQHLAFPPAIVDGRFAVVDQDSPQHTFGLAEAVLRCPAGFIESEPTLGRPRLAFESPPDAAVLRDAVEQHVPGAELVTDTQLTQLAADIFVEVRTDRD